MKLNARTPEQESLARMKEGALLRAKQFYAQTEPQLMAEHHTTGDTELKASAEVKTVSSST